ncbi:MAG: LysM peptidoglycan-binding domain-containing protein [Candidatus Dormibacteraeota bacterium]|nr:LysM peptidoglycan-binding domain-containing protein [Candidatus Dormibacteraeota bacterium]MBV9524961.1 LysM peptidoglycan-binding domain-containing protein [Candidatus Dormibacteraeota bacterium]
MEQTFGAGTLVRDASAPHRCRRYTPARRRPRAWVVAIGVAFTALVGLGGAAYGGATSGPQHVTVHSGDTLWAIAGSHYPGDDVQARVAQLEVVNHLSGAAISPGQVLILPAP